ncbi:hypothetical protein ACIB24_05290 [Spongisporangium articulatum]|uniref:Uncharacterized protein n=1 Tax=Spongisporangium articulatum TaxID=3362603 RepID=A0ABW8AJD2_9ACTN
MGDTRRARLRRPMVAGALLLTAACSAGPGAATTSPSARPSPAAGASPFATPSAQDGQGCRYVRERLAVPARFPHASPEGGDGGEWIAGTVDDTTDDAGDWYPAVWHRGRVQVLRTPGGRRGRGVDVNSAGVVVGQVRNPDLKFDHAYLWRDGRPVRLQGRGKPVAINDSGLVVGTARVDGHRRAVYWRVDDPGTRHVVPGPDADVTVRGVDDSGRIVATASAPVDVEPGRYALIGTVEGLRRWPGMPTVGRSEPYEVRGRYVVGHGSYPGHPSPDSTGTWLWDGVTFAALPAGVDGWRVNAHGLVAGTEDYSEFAVVVEPGTNRVVELPLDEARWTAYVSTVLDDGSVVGGVRGWDSDDKSTGVQWRRTC